MIVVSDTSPILNLSVVGKLYLLNDLYEEIVLPPAVQMELSRNGIDLDPSWTRVVAAQNQNDVAVLREQLDPGEAEAIVIAIELEAELLLVDEKRGRRIANRSWSGSNRPSWSTCRGQGPWSHSSMSACTG